MLTSHCCRCCGLWFSTSITWKVSFWRQDVGCCGDEGRAREEEGPEVHRDGECPRNHNMKEASLLLKVGRSDAHPCTLLLLPATPQRWPRGSFWLYEGRRRFKTPVQDKMFCFLREGRQIDSINTTSLEFRRQRDKRIMNV